MLMYLGIIDDLSIDLNNGLNVLTGETGAGKTLIIDSLGIISGGRFSKEMIRKGETNSFVEICMYQPENENSIEENISLNIPAGTQSGEQIVIPNKGYKDGLGGRGNLIAEIKTVVPKELSEKEKALFTELQHISTFNPRAM